MRTLITGCRVSHISQSSPDQVELSLYHPDRPGLFLVVALLPLKPILFLTGQKPPALDRPPNFCRSLRKNLDYAQVTGIVQVPGQRLVEIHLKTREETFRLIFEGLPKYPNLILAESNGNIISALRYRNDPERPVLPQVTYAPAPQPGDKLDLWSLTGGALFETWVQAGRPALGSWLKTEVRGTDPELCGYLESFSEGAFAEWDRVKKLALEGPWHDFHLFLGPPPVLRLFHESLPTAKERETFPAAYQALARLFQLENLHRHWLSQKTTLESEITKALKHEKRILEKLKKDRSEAERSDQYQWWGELIMAHLHKIKIHTSEALLEDLVRGNPDSQKVPLDPDSTPLLNAQRYFKKAQKGSRGLVQVERREAEVKARIEQLKSAQRSLPALKDGKEMRKAYQDLFPAAKAAPKKPSKPKAEKVPTPNIVRKKIGREFELCVGTSAAANEYVTFQLAQPEDLWFHVRDLPGSHVVLRRLHRGVEPSEELILFAAKAAAARSKAKPGEKVTVSYTEKKNVRRIPGAPMGMVTLTKEKSLTLEV